MKKTYFHKATRSNAKKILKKGFNDGTGSYQTKSQYSGVWLSEEPLSSHEGAVGAALLAVDLPKELVEQYKWKGKKKQYREFLVPAKEINSHGRPYEAVQCDNCGAVAKINTPSWRIKVVIDDSITKFKKTFVACPRRECVEKIFGSD